MSGAATGEARERAVIRGREPHTKKTLNKWQQSPEHHEQASYGLCCSHAGKIREDRIKVEEK